MINWDNGPKGATHWHKDHGWIKNDYHEVTNYNGFMWENGILANVLSTAIKRPKAATPKQEEKEMNDWLKPNIECEFNHPEFGWTGCDTIGWFRGLMVCAPNGGGFYGGEKGDFRPVKTDKEKWIEEAYKTYKESGKEDIMIILDKIYDAGLAKV